MIIAAHTVAGAVSAQVFTASPISAFAIGFISHFILDAIPHWDYPLSIVSGNTDKKSILKDFIKLSADFLAGVLLVLVFIYLPAQAGWFGLSSLVIWSGALGGIFPDVLRNLAGFRGFKFLSFFRKFHDKFHSPLEIKSPVNLFFQMAFVAILIFLVY